jgi:molybdenum cofactor biosynthesis protein B
VSTEQHRADAPRSVRCFVLTISDTRTAETDVSGNAIVAALQGAGHSVIGRQLVRDEPQDVRAVVRSQVGSAEVIVTTGGTGIASRDSTYEAIASLF